MNDLPPIGEIVPGVLYVGTKEHAADADLLREVGLSHVMYLADHAMSPHPGLVTYNHIVVDAPVTDAMEVEHVPAIPFKTCAAYISKTMRLGDKVLVHGMGRDVAQSASVAISFIMQHLELSTDEATAYVKARWRVSIPNSIYVPQLRSWGNYLNLKGFNITYVFLWGEGGEGKGKG
jgi:protein-tyrosine phosphatase